MFYTHAVVSNITLNYLFILRSTYTIILNDKLNQRIPQYNQEYNDTH